MKDDPPLTRDSLTRPFTPVWPETNSDRRLREVGTCRCQLQGDGHPSSFRLHPSSDSCAVAPPPPASPPPKGSAAVGLRLAVPEALVRPRQHRHQARTDQSTGFAEVDPAPL